MDDVETRMLELTKVELRIIEAAMMEFNAASLRRLGSHRTKERDQWMFEARYTAGVSLYNRIAAAVKSFEEQ